MVMQQQNIIITLTSDFGPGPYVGLMKGGHPGPVPPRPTWWTWSTAWPPRTFWPGPWFWSRPSACSPRARCIWPWWTPAWAPGGGPWWLRGPAAFGWGRTTASSPRCYLADPQAKAYEISDRVLVARALSATFHGRDIFAPAAAALAAGRDPASLGPLVSDPGAPGLASAPRRTAPWWVRCSWPTASAT